MKISSIEDLMKLKVSVALVVVVSLIAGLISYGIIQSYATSSVNAADNTLACRADVNQDGVVDSRDLQFLSPFFGKNAPLYDVNGDGVINIIDFSMISSQLGQRCDANVTLASQNACAADLNHDGVVDQTDLQLLARDYGKAGTASDLNGDGVVNILDLSIMAKSIGGKCGATVSSACSTADVNHDGIVDQKDLQLISGDFGKKGSPYDVDGDGTVTILDLSKASKYFGQTCSSVPTPATTPPSGGGQGSTGGPSLGGLPTPTPAATTDNRIANWCNGADINQDGSVNILDASLVQQGYGTKYSILDYSKVQTYYGKTCKA